MDRFLPLVVFLVVLLLIAVVRGILDGREGDVPFYRRPLMFLKNMALTAFIAAIGGLAIYGLNYADSSEYSALIGILCVTVFAACMFPFIGSVGMMFGSVVVDSFDLRD